MSDSPSLEKQIAAVEEAWQEEHERWTPHAPPDGAQAYMDALLAAAETLRGMRWRPIEEAPRDGREVILWWPEAKPHRAVTGWSDGFGWKATGLSRHTSGTPAHWMPLPPPPQEGE